MWSEIQRNRQAASAKGSNTTFSLRIPLAVACAAVALCCSTLQAELPVSQEAIRRHAQSLRQTELPTFAPNAASVLRYPSAPVSPRRISPTPQVPSHWAQRADWMRARRPSLAIAGLRNSSGRAVVSSQSVAPQSGIPQQVASRPTVSQQTVEPSASSLASRQPASLPAAALRETAALTRVQQARSTAESESADDQADPALESAPFGLLANNRPDDETEDDAKDSKVGSAPFAWADHTDASFESLFGVSPEELRQRRIEQLLRSAPRVVQPTSAEETSSLLSQDSQEEDTTEEEQPSEPVIRPGEREWPVVGYRGLGSPEYGDQAASLLGTSAYTAPNEERARMQENLNRYLRTISSRSTDVPSPPRANQAASLPRVGLGEQVKILKAQIPTRQSNSDTNRTGTDYFTSPLQQPANTPQDWFPIP